MTASPLAALFAGVLLAGTAHAEVGAPLRLERVTGVVTALTDSAISLQTPGGVTRTIPLLPDWSVVLATTIPAAGIRPGTYLGVTHHPTSGVTGMAIEVHSWPMGHVGPGVDFGLDAAANTALTDGVVSKVGTSEAGVLLTVDFGPGARTVTVPPGVPVVVNHPGERARVKVGTTVRVTTFQVTATDPTHQEVIIDEPGPPPPT